MKRAWEWVREVGCLQREKRKRRFYLEERLNVIR